MRIAISILRMLRANSRARHGHMLAEGYNESVPVRGGSVRASAVLLILLIVISAHVAALGSCSTGSARLSHTMGFVAENKLKDKRVHILGYQNFAQSLITEGNAMLLPFPAVPGSMSQNNIIDSSSKPHSIDSMYMAIQPPSINSGLVALFVLVVLVLTLVYLFRRFPRLRGLLVGFVCVGFVILLLFTFNIGSITRPEEPLVFDHDVYTIVIAQDISQIPAALERVPQARRPKLNTHLLEAYERWYKGWTFALCCFENQANLGSRPLVWWYEPLYPDLLFFPAISAQDGKPPDLEARVPADHSVFVATDSRKPGSQFSAWKTVDYSKTIIDYSQIRWNRPAPVKLLDEKDSNQKPRGSSPAIAEILPESVMGESFSTVVPQGDLVFRVQDVRAGVYNPLRVLPPGAPQTSAIWADSAKTSRTTTGE